MTAVIGILNKRGVALAADSAETYSRIQDNETKQTKYLKSGSKMFRISDVIPISVMTTGNADFFRNSWDIIIRCYRRERGGIKHDTVEKCMNDFFDYLSKKKEFWQTYIVDKHITNCANLLLKEMESYKHDADCCIGFLNRKRKELKANVKGVHFKDYKLQQFSEYVKTNLDLCFESHHLPSQLAWEIRQYFESTLLTMLTTRNDDDTGLIFCGFGDKEKYPSLISARVWEGFDNRVNYSVRPEGIIHINSDKPVAICPFAQTDVVDAIICGLHTDWMYETTHNIENMFSEPECLFKEDIDDNLFDIITDVEYDDLSEYYHQCMEHAIERNKLAWRSKIKDMDVESMALLAESLIDLTGFHRILTFEQEGVGGPVDVATITQKDGFKWINRKSWYHHKDVNGQYGPLGI